MQNEEVLDLLCDGNVSDYGRAIILDEFSSPRYFNSDMNKLLSDIEKKIDSL